MRFRITYTRREDFVRDLDTQLTRGGIFVNVPPPDGLQYGMRLPLEIVAPDGTVARSDGEVLASMPGQGLALAVPREAVEQLRAVIARLTFEAPGATAPKHEVFYGATPAPAPPVGSNPTPPPFAPPLAVASATPPVSPPRAAPVDVVQGWDSLTPVEKMRLAQFGERDERAAVLRDKNRSLHPHVLKNPRITIEEVVAIARNPQIASEMLKLIAERSEWSSRTQVADALARNPKTPNEVGVRMLANCSSEAVRQMAKGTGAPPHVIQAARKRVIG